MAFMVSSGARRLLASGPDPFSESGEVRGLRVVGAAVLALLRAEARGEVRRADVDEALLHTLLSIDAPRSDRVHLRARVAGVEMSVRDAAALLTTSAWPKWQNACAISRIETRAEGFFDVEPAEAFARVVSTYTVNWSNFMPYAPAVRAHFMSDSTSAQQAFLRAFLSLYDDGTDVTYQPGADRAAAFLRERQRFLAWHTMVLNDVAPARRLPDAGACESALHVALTAYVDALTSASQAVREVRSEFFHLEHLADAARKVHTASKTSPLADVLVSLLVPAPMVASLTLAQAVLDMTAEGMSLEYTPLSPSLAAALPLLSSTHAALAAAANAVLGSGC